MEDISWLVYVVDEEGEAFGFTVLEGRGGTVGESWGDGGREFLCICFGLFKVCYRITSVSSMGSIKCRFGV
jgi:hypothetical protein